MSALTTTVEAPAEAPVPTPEVNPLAHLPAPFCEITRVQSTDDTAFAYKEDGTIVAELPLLTALRILTLLDP